MRDLTPGPRTPLYRLSCRWPSHAYPARGPHRARARARPDGAAHRPRQAILRIALRALPRRRRQRRRDGAGHRAAAPAARPGSSSRSSSATAFRPRACRRTSIEAAELTDLIGFLRTIERRDADAPIVRKTITTADNRPLTGRVLGEGFDDLQLRTDDERVHLLRRTGDRFRARDVERRLADLQRRDRRQSLHDADADRQDQRRAARAGVDVLDSRRRPAAGHAGRRRTASCTSPRRTSASRSTPAPAARSGTTSGRAPRASPAAGPTAASASPAIASSW